MEKPWTTDPGPCSVVGAGHYPRTEVSGREGVIPISVFIRFAGM